MAIPHPLSALSTEETEAARAVVAECHPGVVLDFRCIFLREPPKAEVVKFLDLEHAGKLAESTPRPPRLGLVQYDVIGGSKVPEYHESIINIPAKKRVAHEIVSSDHHASLSM